MANSLRAKLSKLRHDGHITDAEYQAFIKKLDGHDKKIRAKDIDELKKRFRADFEEMMANNMEDCINWADWLDTIAEEMRGAE